MLFNSLTFIVFFAVVFAALRLRMPWTAKKTFLLVASWVFYSAAHPPLVALLILSTLGNWLIGARVGAATVEARRRAWVAVAVVLNVGVLATFKYGRFLVENAATLAHALGVRWNAPAVDLPLPIGVSFFTFQALSYVVDVYRRDIEPARSPLDFAVYASFFPHLVAGPIVRASLFLPQLVKEKRADAAAIDRGMALVVFGLFQKVVLADAVLAPVADAVFAQGVRPDAVSAWAGTIAFAGQIFCDFAGYTTAAIGLALTLGFTLNENFLRPYAAATFSDFWRRWHVSLSSWLRDYLYRPLGGDRRGGVRTYVNLMLVMLLGGLWHGASWTFVAWGGLHGLFLVVERAFGAQRAPVHAVVRGLRRAATWFGVVVGWVFFRAHDFASAGVVLRGMAGLTPSHGAWHLDGASAAAAVLATSAVVACHVFAPDVALARTIERAPRIRLAAALAACFVSFIVLAQPDRAFIYFQF